MYSISVHRYRQIDHVPKSTFLVSFMVLFVVHTYCHTLIAVLRMVLSKVLVLLVLIFSCHGIVIYIVISHILLGTASWRL